MTSQCPRCASPRLGDYPFCHQCGFDFRFAGGPAMPPQQPLYGSPPQQPYGAPQAPYYYQPQLPPRQAPAYQPPNQWAAPWQIPAPQPAGPPATYQPPAAYQPAAQTVPTASDASAEAVPATDQATPDQSAAWQPPTASSVCLRCYAPLHPGYAHCSNCGFDNSTAWVTTAPAASPTTPPLAFALALLGAGLIAAAGAVFFVAQSSAH
jgi:hypothetical protein